MPSRFLAATLGCFVLALVVLQVTVARATPIFSVAAGQCDKAAAQCVATNGIITSTALKPKLITPSEDDPAYVDFESAFDSWNLTLAADKKWSLTEASLTPDATLSVTLYHAFVDGGCGVKCGGAEIEIHYTPGLPADPTRIVDISVAIGPTMAVWSQAIDTNKKLAPSLPGNPYLDNPPGIAGAILDPPAYPFQYVDSYFYDKPSRDASAVWIGDAFLATADYDTRELVVFDGVQWGFTLVPEPTSLAIFAGGLAWLWRKRRRNVAEH